MSNLLANLILDLEMAVVRMSEGARAEVLLISLIKQTQLQRQQLAAPTPETAEVHTASEDSNKGKELFMTRRTLAHFCTNH